MKSLALVLLFPVFAAVGCVRQSEPIRKGDSLESRARISYYDRNGDGKVDLEKHQHPGVADADWELRDDDYNGRYEKKVLYGIGVIKSAVDLPVAKGVRITATER